MGVNKGKEGLIVYAWDANGWIDVSDQLFEITRCYDVPVRHDPIARRKVYVPHMDSEIVMLFLEDGNIFQSPKAFVVF